MDAVFYSLQVDVTYTGDDYQYSAILQQEGSPEFIAEQGHWMGRPGTAIVEVLGPPDAISGVKVGGTARILMRGTLDI